MLIERDVKDLDIYADLTSYGAGSALTPEGFSMIHIIVKRFRVSQDAARVRLSVLDYLGAAASLPF